MTTAVNYMGDAAVPHPDEYNDARVDGKHARRAGLPNGKNPYPLGTNEFNGWKFGWWAEDSFIASGGVKGIHRRAEERRRTRDMSMAPLFDLISGRAAE